MSYVEGGREGRREGGRGRRGGGGGRGGGREGERERRGEGSKEGRWEEERLRGGRRAMARGVTLNGSNESVYSMIRQPSLFVKNTKSSRFVSLFLGEGMWEREGEGDGSRNGRRERGERENIPDDGVHAFHL